MGEGEGRLRRRRGDGEQRMQRQSGKTCRAMTPHGDTDEAEGEEADFDGPLWAGYYISKMVARHRDLP